MLGNLVVGLHVIASIALIMIVLLQTGRGAEMGAAFGGASQTLFGGSGGNTFLGKLTTGAAVVVMITCLLLSYRPMAVGGKSIMHDVPVEQATEAPAPAPAAPATAPEATPAVPPPVAAPAPAVPAPVATPAPEPSAKAEPPAAAQQQAQPAQPAPEAAKQDTEKKAPAAPAKPQAAKPDNKTGK